MNIILHPPSLALNKTFFNDDNNKEVCASAMFRIGAKTHPEVIVWKGWGETQVFIAYFSLFHGVKGAFLITSLDEDRLLVGGPPSPE